jgi:hypothetical protein
MWKLPLLSASATLQEAELSKVNLVDYRFLTQQHM